MRRWIVVVVLGLGVALACTFGHDALAGKTGGSMGGGSWGSRTSSSSSGFSSSPSHSSSYSYSGGGGGYYSSGYSSGSGDLGLDLAFIVGGLVIALVVAAAKRAQMSGYGDTPNFDTSGPMFDNNGTVLSNYADVSVIRIALDGRARKFVQSELARVAKCADTATAEGRATMLREVALLLRRLKDAWVYGGAVNEQMRAEMAQKAVFDRYVDDARARFTNETVRNEQGVTTTAAAPEASREARSDEGLILVTIVIAAHSELFEISNIGDGDSLRQALESASHRSAEDLIAIEIIWMPADGDDLVSSMELEAKYPAPDLIPIRGALVGKVFCAYCSGPFPAELVSCPHCGAPAAGATAAHA